MPPLQATMKSVFPPRSRRSKQRVQNEPEEDTVSSPESPEHQRPVTATSQEDLSYTDFAALDDFLKEPKGLVRRKKKLPSVDVASVGNASDTMVSVSSNSHMSGRELHEKAKVSNFCRWRVMCPTMKMME